MPLTLSDSHMLKVSLSTGSCRASGCAPIRAARDEPSGDIKFSRTQLRCNIVTSANCIFCMSAFHGLVVTTTPFSKLDLLGCDKAVT